ncbi:hypothetical protein EJ04DRAFT_547656 [Polyplosphaeria fusca]|uniref:Uncharacterized protein n=1 Tax=Polyplosphaeria fusca TaxID=682080 RepID=A0A9P4V946_9PLEO|nr:hypothetical protein EJ04DRAFT_547656 [Polyplosphaeria fusca]
MATLIVNSDFFVHTIAGKALASTFGTSLVALLISKDTPAKYHGNDSCTDTKVGFRAKIYEPKDTIPSKTIIPMPSKTTSFQNDATNSATESKTTRIESWKNAIFGDAEHSLLSTALLILLCALLMVLGYWIYHTLKKHNRSQSQVSHDTALSYSDPTVALAALLVAHEQERSEMAAQHARNMAAKDTLLAVQRDQLMESEIVLEKCRSGIQSLEKDKRSLQQQRNTFENEVAKLRQEKASYKEIWKQFRHQDELVKRHEKSYEHQHVEARKKIKELEERTQIKDRAMERLQGRLRQEGDDRRGLETELELRTQIKDRIIDALRRCLRHKCKSHKRLKMKLQAVRRKLQAQRWQNENQEMKRRTLVTSGPSNPNNGVHMRLNDSQFMMLTRVVGLRRPRVNSHPPRAIHHVGSRIRSPALIPNIDPAVTQSSQLSSIQNSQPPSVPTRGYRPRPPTSTSRQITPIAATTLALLGRRRVRLD